MHFCAWLFLAVLLFSTPTMETGMMKVWLERVKFRRSAAQILFGAFATGSVFAYTLVILSGPAPTARRVLTVNPYRDVDWETVLHCKANLHTHTTVSDGKLMPHQVVDEYRQRGYGVLALTDHNRATYPWTAFDSFSPEYENRDPAALGMLAVAGNELSRHHHAQSLFSAFESSGTDLDAVLDELAASSAGARSLINHPAWHWTRTSPATGFRIPMAPALRQVTQGDFTAEAWFRCADTERNILMGNYSTGHKGALNLELHTDNRVRLYLQSESGSVIDRNLSAGATDTRDGQWHHLAGVRRAGKIRVYLDGQQLGAEANDTLGAFTLQGDAWWIGRDTRAGATEFTGDLDQVRLWTRGLDAGEVASLAAGAAPDGGLPQEGVLAEYRFDRPAQADDTAGHADGPFHAARAEPGYRVPLAPSLRRATQGDFTLDAWFRTTDAGRNILMGNYLNGTLGALNLELHTGNRVRVYVQPPAGQGGATVSLFATPQAATRDGRWRHLAGVRRGGDVCLYLDGKEVGRTADTAGAFDLQGDAAWLGRDARTGETAFKGDLDALRVWSRALTPEEIALLATAAARSEAGVPRDALLARYALEPSTLARDTAGHAAGPFDGECAAFSSALRVDDVAAALKAAGHSSDAVRLGWTPAYPTSVPPDVAEYYAGFFERHPRLVGMEVLNGTMQAREYPLDRELWDILLTRLMPGRPVWGFANDDMHSLTQLGRDSITLLMQAVDEESVRRALDNGTFTFASTRVRPEGGDGSVPPPRLERVGHDAGSGTLTLAATSGGAPLPDSAYAWIAAGKTVQTGPVFAYRAAGATNGYVRAEITGPGGTLYTNPFGFRVAGAAADQ
jgi:hypothetical protein